ncbi:DUF4062 domain-containing protein [Nitrosomonas communis]|uniref:NACHT domain-containing protein n=1 Tax=Nitrosomonas communis TaxID=44574 RepID=A0A1I4RP27_9PROT|nr:DUF4062 domain-containing protein [Nitrosomonas communis]SFM53998.1 NACHT domain-containing protein [Nitrosomonas communis]
MPVVETYHVFISSTWQDLKPERKAVEEVLQRMRETKLNGMEYFGSREETTREVSLQEVDISDIYIGIFAGRYGSGITEAEYRQALKKNLPCFIYFKEIEAIPDEWHEKDSLNAERLSALKKELTGRHTVTTFCEPHELAARITADLHRWITDKWIASFSNNKEAAGKQFTYDQLHYREVLLNKVKEYWIKGVLERALYTNALIELVLEDRPSAVEHPFIGLQAPIQTLPLGTEATDVFNQMGKGRTLLISGEPGAGKTIALLRLAKNWISRAESDTNLPIPVVFNLSSWYSQDLTIQRWLTQEFKNLYQVSKSTVEGWIKNQELLLLFDGLDEVKAEFREDCVRAINQFMQEYGMTELVVCCRRREYEALTNRLRLRGAICLQPISEDQITQYLTEAGEQLQGVQMLLEEDETLREIIKTPLLLSIVSLAYKNKKAADIARTGSLEERRKDIFDTYIEEMFNKEIIFKKPGTVHQYPPAHTKKWLGWLAQRMQKESQTVFLMEKIKPTWLSKSILFYRFSVALIFLLITALTGLITGTIIGVFCMKQFLCAISEPMPLFKNAMISYAKFMAYGLFVAVIAGWRSSANEIKLAETFNWSWKAPVRNGLRWATYALILLFFVGLFANITTQKEEFSLVLIFKISLEYAILIGISRSLIGGPIYSEEISRLRVNQGIWRSGKRGVFIGLITFSLIAIIYSIYYIYLQNYRIHDLEILEKEGFLISISSWFFTMIMGGLIGGWMNGGAAFIQHFTLRFLLWRRGNMPLRYAEFLNYASDRLFLQKVGGGYIFIHRMLLEHFAQMPLSNGVSTKIK